MEYKRVNAIIILGLFIGTVLGYALCKTIEPMSLWYEIKNEENIELSEDKKTVEIYIEGLKVMGEDGIYVEIPIELLKRKIEE